MANTSLPLLTLSILLLLPGCHAAPSDITATWLGEGKKIADFKLLDHDGEPFTQEHLKGHWSLVFFGYTYCPDICPTTLATLKQVYQALIKTKTPPHVVFISVDPKRDTLTHLKHYVTSFNKQFKGITGALSQLTLLTGQLGVLFVKNPSKTDNAYLIDHSTSILLVNPKGSLQAIWGVPLKAEAIIQDYQKIVSAS